MFFSVKKNDIGFFPDACGEGYIVPLHKKAA